MRIKGLVFDTTCTTPIRNDWNSLQWRHCYPDLQIKAVGLYMISGDLQYLSEALTFLSVFDPDTYLETKQATLKALKYITKEEELLPPALVETINTKHKTLGDLGTKDINRLFCIYGRVRELS